MRKEGRGEECDMTTHLIKFHVFTHASFLIMRSWNRPDVLKLCAQPSIPTCSLTLGTTVAVPLVAVVQSPPPPPCQGSPLNPAPPSYSA